MESKIEDGDFDFKMTDDTKYLIFDYRHAGDLFRLIYYKNRDLAVAEKNGRHIKTDKLTASENYRFKKVLDIAITYHHDRDDCLIQ